MFPRKEKEQRVAAAVRRGIPDCPDHLDDEARAEWDRITAELHAAGLLAHVDRAVVAAYCQAWSRWVEAEKTVAKSGPVLKSQQTGKLYPNPYLAVAERSMKQMQALLGELGMSPLARRRLEVNLEDDRPDLVAFLGEGA